MIKSKNRANRPWQDRSEQLRCFDLRSRTDAVIWNGHGLVIGSGTEPIDDRIAFIYRVSPIEEKINESKASLTPIVAMHDDERKRERSNEKAPIIFLLFVSMTKNRTLVKFIPIITKRIK